MGLLDLRVDEFLNELAGEATTPSGGSLAALVTASAAALLAKVARASKANWPEAAGVAAQAESLRDRSAPLVQLSAERYEAALRSLDGDPDEPSPRRDFAVGRAHSRAAEPPLQIVEAATDVAALAEVVARNCNPALRPDAAAAAALAAAAARAASELVAVNLTAASGDERVERARRLADDAALAADSVATE